MLGNTPVSTQNASAILSNAQYGMAQYRNWPDHRQATTCGVYHQESRAAPVNRYLDMTREIMLPVHGLESERLRGVGVPFASIIFVCHPAGARMSSVLKKRRKKMRKHKHKKLRRRQKFLRRRS